MKAILLVRKSSDTQELEEQKLQLADYVIANFKYKKKDLIIVEHSESAIKMRIDKRDGIKEMKHYIENDSSINAVFVWELSRLVRYQTDGHILKDYFGNNKIQFYCVIPEFRLFNDDISAPDDIGDITFALFLQIAEGEMRTKKARFHRSKIRNAKTGKYSGGFVKYGYYVDDKGYYQIKEDEAKLIKYVFNRYEEGISIWKLNKELMERGLTDSLSFVNETLKCEAYTGVSNKYGMNRVYPQIISIEQFNRCKEIKKSNNKKLDKTNEIYFGKGLIKCTHCGAKYMAMKTSIQYLCYNRFGREQKLNPSLACRKSPIININILDTILFEACVIEETYYLMNNYQKVVDGLNEQKQINLQKIEAAKVKITKAKGKKERNNDMFMMGTIGKEKYLENIKLIDAEIRKHQNIVADFTNLNNKLTQNINDATEEKKGFSRSYQFNEDKVYAIDDLIQKQKIIQRHIQKVNIFDEIPKHTKLVNIYFYRYGLPLQYRVHYKKMPQRIEINESFYAGDSVYTYHNDFDNTAPNFWVDVDFKIEKRFVRKAN